MKFPLLVWSLLLCYWAGAQPVLVQTSLDFGAGSYQLTAIHQQRLDKIGDTLKKIELETVTFRSHIIIGSDSLRHIQLLQNRVEAAKKYLHNKGADIGSIITEYNYKKGLGWKELHRMEIVVKGKLPDVLPVGAITVTIKGGENHDPAEGGEIPAAAIQVEDNCDNDTVVDIDGKSAFVIRRCDFTECMQAEAVPLLPDGEDNPPPVADTKGRPFTVFGRWCFASCTDSCYAPRVMLRVWVGKNQQGLYPRDLYLYQRVEKGWRRADQKVKLVKDKDSQYLECEVKCPGDIVMMSVGNPCKEVKVKLKLKGGNKIVRFETVDSLPVNYTAYETETPSKYIYVQRSDLNKRYWAITYKDRKTGKTETRWFDNNSATDTKPKRGKRNTGIEVPASPPGKWGRSLRLGSRDGCHKAHFPYVFFPRHSRLVIKPIYLGEQ